MSSARHISVNRLYKVRVAGSSGNPPVYSVTTYDEVDRINWPNLTPENRWWPPEVATIPAPNESVGLVEMVNGTPKLMLLSERPTTSPC